MLNRKSIERALARAAGHQDESVVARLALFAPALLKAADLVRSRRDGKTVFYALADDHVRTIIGQGMDHVNE